MMRGMFRDHVEASRRQLWSDLRALITSYARHDPVRSVAVVGNKPLEPEAERAAAIDRSDLVVRCNSLVLDEPGDEPTLGSACHVVLLNHATHNTPWVFRDYRRRLYLVPQAGFTRYHKVNPQVSFWPADLGAIPVPNAVVTKPLVDRMDPDHVPARLIPTSGLLALYIAHELFSDAEMVASGFSFVDARDQTEWRHHSGSSTGVPAFHDLHLEGALLQSWIDDRSVRFFR
jgi:hypothetical protein